MKKKLKNNLYYSFSLISIIAILIIALIEFNNGSYIITLILLISFTFTMANYFKLIDWETFGHKDYEIH